MVHATRRHSWTLNPLPLPPLPSPPPKTRAHSKRELAPCERAHACTHSFRGASAASLHPTLDPGPRTPDPCAQLVGLQPPAPSPLTAAAQHLVAGTAPRDPFAEWWALAQSFDPENDVKVRPNPLSMIYAQNSRPLGR